MAMLAEPRRKKRYNLCPRGKALYEGKTSRNRKIHELKYLFYLPADDSRFGTKMLEKMGWSKGRGLGANEDGSQEFVRIRFKNDAEGLGYEARDDQWTVHEEGFNGLLKALNGEENNENEKSGGVGSASEDEARPMGFGFKPEPVVEKAKPKSLKENISGVSLEEKSKVSKARVHYKKFTRGKDLAQYSEKDLANIFGKKATEAIDSPVQIIPEPEPVEEEKTLNPNFGGVQTVSTGLSVSDYFRMKMEAMKNKLKNNATNGGGEPKTVNGEDAQPNGIATDGAEEQPVKKKKKKKDKELEDEPEPETAAGNANADEEQPAKKKKKKKDKEQDQELEQENDNTEVAAPEQKKKKKSKRKPEDEPVQPEQAVVECEEINPPKRKKKKNRQDDTNENVDTAEPTLPSEEKSVEPKKNKSKKSEDIVEEETEANHFEEAEKPTKKKNKKNKDNKEEPLAESEPIETESNSKRKSKITHEAQKESSPVEISEDSENKTKKKSKKNKTLLVVEPQPDEPITKKKKNSSQKHESEVSVDDDSDSSATSESTDNYLTHEQLLEKLDSFNVYTTSSFCAEKFHLVDMKKFKNSSLPQISGYSIEENINLKIVETKYDANRIMSLWENRSNKYVKSKETNQKVNNYYKGINPTAIKAIRRTQAFTGI